MAKLDAMTEKELDDAKARAFDMFTPEKYVVNVGLRGYVPARIRSSDGVYEGERVKILPHYFPYAFTEEQIAESSEYVKGLLKPEFWISSNEESFSDGPYESREDAIAAAPGELDLEEGQRFWTCEAEWETNTFPPDAEWIIDTARDNAGDGAPECAEDWLDVTKEQIADLDAMLETTWNAWLDKRNLRPRWFQAKDTQQHVCPEREVEE